MYLLVVVFVGVREILCLDAWFCELRWSCTFSLFTLMFVCCIVNSIWLGWDSCVFVLLCVCCVSEVLFFCRF